MKITEVQIKNLIRKQLLQEFKATGDYKEDVLIQLAKASPRFAKALPVIRVILAPYEGYKFGKFLRKLYEEQKQYMREKESEKFLEAVVAYEKKLEAESISKSSSEKSAKLPDAIPEELPDDEYWEHPAHNPSTPGWPWKKWVVPKNNKDKKWKNAKQKAQKIWNRFNLDFAEKMKKITGITMAHNNDEPSGVCMPYAWKSPGRDYDWPGLGLKDGGSKTYKAIRGYVITTRPTLDYKEEGKTHGEVSHAIKHISEQGGAAARIARVAEIFQGIILDNYKTTTFHFYPNPQSSLAYFKISPKDNDDKVLDKLEFFDDPVAARDTVASTLDYLNDRLVLGVGHNKIEAQYWAQLGDILKSYQDEVGAVLTKPYYWVKGVTQFDTHGLWCTNDPTSSGERMVHGYIPQAFDPSDKATNYKIVTSYRSDGKSSTELVKDMNPKRLYGTWKLKT